MRRLAPCGGRSGGAAGRGSGIGLKVWPGIDAIRNRPGRRLFACPGFHQQPGVAPGLPDTMPARVLPEAGDMQARAVRDRPLANARINEPFNSKAAGIALSFMRWTCT
jgi:hypothetical protein